MNDMTKVVGQMMCLPFTVFASSVEAFGRSFAGGGWVAEAARGVTCPPCEAPKPVVCETPAETRHDRDWECRDRCGEGLACPTDWHDDREGWRRDCGDRHDEWCGRCGRRSCDCCCGCSSEGSDKVKLVEYSLVVVRRGKSSHILEGPKQELVSDCTDLEELRNQVIVDYVQRRCRKPDEPPIDGKHLRVYTKVLACWCKEDVDWCEEQVDALQSIAHTLRDRPAS